MSKDPRMLIGGFATGSLNKTEEKRLIEAAIENQEIFDQLLDIDPLRGALANPQFRAQIKADLRERVQREGIPLTERLRRLFFRPGVIPAMSVALTVVVAILVRQGVLQENSPAVQIALGPQGVPLMRAAGILDSRQGEDLRLREVRDQPVRKSASGQIAFDRPGRTPAYREGDPMRLGFQVPKDASVVMVEETEDGAVTRLFPNRFQSSAEVTGGETISVPPAGQGPLEVEGPPGRHIVRVLIFPPGVDPLDPTQSWETIRQQASVVEKAYEVER